MATVVFDNNGGAGTGVWSLNTNWVGDALPGDTDKAQISADCTLDVSDVIDSIIVDSGKTLTMAAGCSLSGMQAVGTGTGTIYMNAGCKLLWNVNGNSGPDTISITGRGTSANRCLIDNQHATGTIHVNGRTLTYNIEYTDIHSIQALYFGGGSPLIRMVNCDIEGGKPGTTRGQYFIPSGVVKILQNVWISNFSGSNAGCWLIYQGTPKCTVENVTFGKDRDGNVQTNLPADVSIAAGGLAAMRNAAFFSTSHIVLASTSFTDRAIVDNYGFNPADATPGTPGVSVLLSPCFRLERSSTNPPSGKTYHARLTPTSLLDHTREDKRAEFWVYVPVESGDNISVTAKASRSGDSSDCADVVIDPEGAWFTPTTVAWDLTNSHLTGTGATTNSAPGTTLTYATGGFDAIGIVDGTTKVNITSGTGATPGQYTITGHTDTTLTLATSPGASATAIAFTVERYYDLPTCAATGAGGTGAKGTVRVVFRMKEYSASQYLDIGDITITCGGTDYVVSCQHWANGMPVVDELTASGGGGGAIIMQGLGQIGLGVY